MDIVRPSRDRHLMGWHFTDCVETCAASALPFLRRRPAEHTVQLTVIENLRTGARRSATRPLFGWWADAAATVQGMCLHTPPYNMLLTDLPQRALETLAPELYRRSWSMPGVMGRAETAEPFAALWAARTGAGTAVSMRQRLYRLGNLVEPDPLPRGTARPAVTSDRELLIRWFEAFRREAGAITADDVSQVVEDRLAYGGVVLWEAGGAPVAFAGRTRTAAGMARIAPVYTPGGHRGRGYGTAVTAAATRAALASDASDVVLFTDLANPTSNSIYQRIGFEPVSDRLQISFSPGGEET